MNTCDKAVRPMIEERGSPRELAERMTRLPEGQYRVFVQEVRSREDILGDFRRTSMDMRRTPAPETIGKSDDEIMELADRVIRDVRQSSSTA